jgi:hypothetical protein
MIQDPVELELGHVGRRSSVARLSKMTSARDAVRHDLASPAAFDEVFANLASDPQPAMSAARAALDAAPLVTFAASLERQHERIATLLRDIESGTAS